MRIAIDLLRGKSLTGNQVYTIELLKALIREGSEHEYRALVYLNKKKEARKAVGEYRNISYLNGLLHDRLLGRGLKSVVSGVSDGIKRIVAKDVDLYHCTNPNGFPMGVRNGVVTLHDLIALRHEPWSTPGSRQYYRENIGSVLRSARLVFTVSDFTRFDALNYFPELEGKLYTTPLAANPLFRKADVDRGFLSNYGISDPVRPFILSVGEIQPRKNQQGFFEAFKALPEKIRREYQIIVVGSAKLESSRNSFEQMLCEMNRVTVVHHLQNVPFEDLVKLYNLAYAFVYLSFFEGFGLPVVEAMSCGCPVLTSSTTSLGEVAGDAALTVNPEDRDAVVCSLEVLLGDSVLRTGLIRKGLDRAAGFSWRNTARLTIQGYKRAMNA